MNDNYYKYPHGSSHMHTCTHTQRGEDSVRQQNLFHKLLGIKSL